MKVIYPVVLTILDYAIILLVIIWMIKIKYHIKEEQFVFLHLIFWIIEYVGENFTEINEVMTEWIFIIYF